ncbi:MAG: hypothetical protein BroJett011_62600 [Chloroflexota bacterium]|nr:MAG: hypothetical protein BroJett011_62600 [Chloroflexota bacterium]
MDNPVTARTGLAVEIINGKSIPTGTLDEFSRAIYRKKLTGDDGRLSGLPGEPGLGIEKFKTAGLKFYRLVWVGLARAWLAAEDTTPYRSKYLAVAGGELLAGQTGAGFSEATR